MIKTDHDLVKITDFSMEELFAGIGGLTKYLGLPDA
jgi:hypothetical protein